MDFKKKTGINQFGTDIPEPTKFLVSVLSVNFMLHCANTNHIIENHTNVERKNSDCVIETIQYHMGSDNGYGKNIFPMFKKLLNGLHNLTDKEKRMFRQSVDLFDIYSRQYEQSLESLRFLSVEENDTYFKKMVKDLTIYAVAKTLQTIPTELKNENGICECFYCEDFNDVVQNFDDWEPEDPIASLFVGTMMKQLILSNNK